MQPFATLCLVVIATVVDGACPTRAPPDQACPEGCYHATGGMNSDGTRPCSSVGAGNYSPADENHRYTCEFGTYSSSDTAGACFSCLAGTYSATAGASRCEVCPYGTYSNLPQSIFCSPCDPEYYDGEGANSIQVWDGMVYCAFTAPPAVAENKATSASPTQGPTFSPPNDAPTIMSSAPEITRWPVDSTISRVEDATDDYVAAKDDDDEWCLETEYEWHDECTECPSTIRSILHPIWMAVVLVAVIATLPYLPSHSTAIVWMGIEYLQLAYFLGVLPTAKDQAPRHSALQHLHRWILSIFAIDLQAGLSLQCLMKLSPAFDELSVLLIPIVLACLLWVVAQALPAAPRYVGRWMAIGFCLWHFQLILISLEALHCSGDEWFCHKPLLSSIAGVAGLSIYGLICPVWVMWARYHHSKVSTDNRMDKAWTSALAFENCWWWPGFWMARRSLLATLPILLNDQTSWTLTAFLVTLMVSELIQRFAAPTAKNPQQQPSNRWLRTGTVDTTLQASLIALTGLSFLALAMPSETMRANGVIIAIFFLTVLTPTVGYWMVSVFYSFLHRPDAEANEDDAESMEGGKSNTSASTSSSSRQRKRESSPCTSPDREVATVPFRPPPPPPPLSTKNADDDMVIHHSLSLIPNAGPGDDLDIETILDDDDLPTWRGSEEYSEWVGTGDAAIRSVLRGRPIDTSSSLQEQHYLAPPSLHFREDRSSASPPLPPPGYDFDDTSTLTDNNSYVPRNQGTYHSIRPYPLKHTSTDAGATSLMESSSSGDGTVPMIFADEDDTPPPPPPPPPREYHIPCRYHYGPDQDYRGCHDSYDDYDDLVVVDDHDNVTEVWIDEATGKPIVDKTYGEWADATTGLPVDSSSNHSSSSHSSNSSQRKLRSHWSKCWKNHH